MLYNPEKKDDWLNTSPTIQVKGITRIAFIIEDSLMQVPYGLWTFFFFLVGRRDLPGIGFVSDIKLMMAHQARSLTKVLIRILLESLSFCDLGQDW